MGMPQSLFVVVPAAPLSESVTYPFSLNVTPCGNAVVKSLLTA